MAITKILSRNAGLNQAIQYALNGDKTEHRILTAHQNFDPGREYRQMMNTKREVGKLDGRQCYHIIQSFKPGEVTPELALEIAKEFASEYLPDYEVVIGTHVDKGHIHSHIVFNSVNGQTGEKYHVTTQEYYRQIRAISDRLCRAHGLSVIMEGGPSQTVSYIEWLRQSKGQPTFRTMLEADLRTAIQDAIQGNLTAIEMGQRPARVYHAPYRPFKKHPKYTGLLALYIHYLYVLGKIEKRQYPPKMTPQLKKEAMRFERCREQFSFLRENNLSTQEDITAFQTRTEDALASLTKQRTILNVRRKKRKKLYDALADVDALAQARQLYEDGLSGMEAEYTRYLEAVAVLEQCPTPRDRLLEEKAGVYEQLAQVNREIRAARKNLAMCQEIQNHLPQMEQAITKIESRENEVRQDERRRR